MRVLLAALPVFFMSQTAQAHLGHLGDVAGHAHWLALGAGVTAAAIAALLAKKKIDAEKTDEPVETGDGGEVHGDDEPQAAGA